MRGTRPPPTWDLRPDRIPIHANLPRRNLYYTRRTWRSCWTAVCQQRHVLILAASVVAITTRWIQHFIAYIYWRILVLVFCYSIVREICRCSPYTKFYYLSWYRNNNEYTNPTRRTRLRMRLLISGFCYSPWSWSPTNLSCRGYW
jgi:hypothetical protein